MNEALIADFPTVSVGTRTLARNLHLTLEPGKIVGLVGPNGCGKSITIDIICGLRKSRGVLLSLGSSRIERLGMLGRWRCGIRRMFQQPALPVDASLGEILGHYSVRSTPAHASSARRLIEVAGLAKGRRVRQMSFGQRRLAELAAVASGGSVFLLDEPFAGLAESFAEEASRVIRRLHTIGAVLLVDHSAERMKALADEVVVWPSPEEPPSNAAHTAAAEGSALFQPPFFTPARPVRWSVGRVWAGGRTLAENLELQTRPGEIVYVIGTNGSGKSTLLRAMAGVPQPAGIEVFEVGRDVPLAGLHLSPQPPKLIPTISAGENLALMWPRGDRQAKVRGQAARELLVQAGLNPSLLTQRAARLSGGEAALVALVGAATSGRPFLLLDEPFEALSIRGRAFASGLFRALLAAGATCIVTAHSGFLESIGGQRLELSHPA